MQRIPLIVLGGFLGAGKTTLLNHLLVNAAGRRIAVLVNDFGPINVDAELIADHDGQTLSLSNGCICCSIGSGLDAALIRVLEHEPAPELIVIEASGVSDPGRIAQVGMSDPLMQLEAVVVMVDAEQVADQLDDPLLADTLARQIESAGLLVLNKTDLVSSAQLEALKSRLTQQFGAIPMLHASHGQVPVEALTGLPEQLQVRHDAHDHAQPPDHPFESGSWSGGGVLDADRLVKVLKQLPRSVIRVKGWVTTDRHGPAVVHMAGRRVRFDRGSAGHQAGLNQLVYIGLKQQHADEQATQAFERLLDPVAP